MKKALILLIVCFAISQLKGQQGVFNNELVDSIIISSKKPLFNEKKQILIIKEYSVAISYDSIYNEYQYSKYYKRNCKVKTNKGIRRSREKVFKSPKEHSINKSVNNLINELSLALETSPDEIKGIKQKDIDKYINKENIMAIVNDNNRAWVFDSLYSLDTVLLNCKNPDTIKEFINFHLYDDLIMVEMIVVTKENKYKFTSANEFFYTLFSRMYINENEKYSKLSINLKINNFLDEILPDDFLLKKEITLESFYKNYLEEYLRKEFIIYSIW